MNAYNKKEKSGRFYKNSIKYLVLNPDDQIPKCNETKQIKETTRKKSVRNFLKKTQKNKYKLLEIKDNKCI